MGCFRDLQILKRLQSYINENELTTEDSDSIRTWNNEHPYVYLKLYVEGRVFYDTEMRSPSGQNSQTRPFLSYSKNGGYPLIFKDRTIQANITVYYSLLFKTALRMGILILGFIIFILVFILLLHHKIRYIKIIEKGLKIIETGSLEYQIPVRGKDELASLAVSINNMSQALYERLEAEESLKQEKSQIVTSLSHDIRTPLTSVICYLDLISDKRYDSPQKMEDYLHKARDKAYQMKEMADNFSMKPWMGMSWLDSSSPNISICWRTNILQWTFRIPLKPHLNSKLTFINCAVSLIISVPMRSNTRLQRRRFV